MEGLVLKALFFLEGLGELKSAVNGVRFGPFLFVYLSIAWKKCNIVRY
jgi:hypothetical protein